MDISIHLSIAAIRDECVLAAQFEFNDVSLAETELILKTLDLNIATGHDQIPACVLQDPVVVEHVLNKELVVVCGGFVITR